MGGGGGLGGRRGRVREEWGKQWVWVLSLPTLVHPFPPVQGAEGVPVAYGPADPLHDQLPCTASAGCHIARGALVPGGLDLGRVPEPRDPSRPGGRRRDSRGSAVQHVQARPLGLHDGCW